MNKILFAAVLLLASSCRKDPLKYTQNLNGMHTWIKTKFDKAILKPPYDTLQLPIIVIDDKTIVFCPDKNAYNSDTLQLSSTDKKNKKIIFTSYYYDPNVRFIECDTLEYNYSNGDIHYCNWESLKTYVTSICYKAL